MVVCICQVLIEWFSKEASVRVPGSSASAPGAPFTVFSVSQTQRSMGERLLCETQGNPRSVHLALLTLQMSYFPQRQDLLAGVLFFSICEHSWMSCPHQGWGGASFLSCKEMAPGTGQLTSKDPRNGHVTALMKAEWSDFATMCFPKG